MAEYSKKENGEINSKSYLILRNQVLNEDERSNVLICFDRQITFKQYNMMNRILFRPLFYRLMFVAPANLKKYLQLKHVLV